jgi:hypothetical protein
MYLTLYVPEFASRPWRRWVLQRPRKPVRLGCLGEDRRSPNGQTNLGKGERIQLTGRPGRRSSFTPSPSEPRSRWACGSAARQSIRSAFRPPEAAALASPPPRPSWAPGRRVGPRWPRRPATARTYRRGPEPPCSADVSATTRRRSSPSRCGQAGEQPGLEHPGLGRWSLVFDVAVPSSTNSVPASGRACTTDTSRSTPGTGRRHQRPPRPRSSPALASSS